MNSSSCRLSVAKTFLALSRVWRTNTRAHTHSAEAGGVCCITSGSTGRQHPPDRSNCQLRKAAGRNVNVSRVRGRLTLIMSSDLRICHCWYLDFSTFYRALLHCYSNVLRSNSMWLCCEASETLRRASAVQETSHGQTFYSLPPLWISNSSIWIKKQRD